MGIPVINIIVISVYQKSMDYDFYLITLFKLFPNMLALCSKTYYAQNYATGSYNRPGYTELYT